MTQNDKYWISSCLMAHINTSGQHIALWLDGPAPVGWGRNTTYPIEEGTFIGDLFASPPIANFCGGRGYGSNVVSGRIGAGQSNAPYKPLKNASKNNSDRCDDTCTMDPSGDGYSSCTAVLGNPITVWRQFTSAPVVSFESGAQGFSNSPSSQPTTLGLSTDQHLSGTRSLLLTVNARGAGNAYVELANPGTKVKPGKNMTFFINIPSGTNWDYVQTYAMDGPAKNYRWSAAGYVLSQNVPGEWSSVVVKVPSDFAVSGSRIGVQIHMTGFGTTKLYVDSLFFDN
jgi:hypothetical protein